MRVAVIRGDLPGPLFLADLEVISQYDPALEPPGQTYYISRPTVAEMVTALAGIPAGLLGTVDMTAIGLPISIHGGGGANNVLKVRTAIAPAPFVSVTIPTLAYATVAALMTAVNLALATAGVAASVSLDRMGIYMVLKSTATGPGAYVEVDSVAGGSNFSAVPGIAIAGGGFTVPAAAAVITATNPVGGPLAVSDGQLLILLGGGPTNAQVTAVRDAVSQRIIETPVAVQSFKVGVLSKYRSATYTPDPFHLPQGAAIAITQDNGTTLFTAPLPTLVSAVIAAGNLTLNGTGLASAENFNAVVKIEGAVAASVSQQAIRHAGGLVGPTLIRIPLSMLPAGLAAVTCLASVKFDTLKSAKVAVS
jgi:hypothetical protein